MASWPFDASPTRFMSGWFRIIVEIPSRRRGWSSTLRILISVATFISRLSYLTVDNSGVTEVQLPAPLHYSIMRVSLISNVARDRQIHFGPCSSAAQYLQLRSDSFRSLTHSGQAPMSLSTCV